MAAATGRRRLRAVSTVPLVPQLLLAGIDTGAMGAYATENSNPPVPAVLGAVLLLVACLRLCFRRARTVPQGTICALACTGKQDLSC